MPRASTSRYEYNPVLGHVVVADTDRGWATFASITKSGDWRVAERGISMPAALYFKPTEDPRKTLTLFIPYNEAKMLLDAAEIGLEGAEDNIPAEDVSLLERAVTNLRTALEPSACPTYEAFNSDGHLVHVTIPEKDEMAWACGNVAPQHSPYHGARCVLPKEHYSHPHSDGARAFWSR